MIIVLLILSDHSPFILILVISVLSIELNNCRFIQSLSVIGASFLLLSTITTLLFLLLSMISAQLSLSLSVNTASLSCFFQTSLIDHISLSVSLKGYSLLSLSASLKDHNPFTQPLKDSNPLSFSYFQPLQADFSKSLSRISAPLSEWLQPHHLSCSLFTLHPCHQ